jgi:hypothetical protein
MNQFLIKKNKKNCCSVSHYIFWWGMNMMYKMQLIFFGLLILALEFQLPFHFSTNMTRNNYVHVLSVFDRISFKYWLFVPQTGLTQRQDNSVLLLQVIVLLNSFCSTIITQIWLSNARSIVGPLTPTIKWYQEDESILYKKKKIAAVSVIISSGEVWTWRTRCN